MVYDVIKYLFLGVLLNVKLVDIVCFEDDFLEEVCFQIFMEMREKLKLEVVQVVYNRNNINVLLLGFGCYDDEDDSEEE